MTTKCCKLRQYGRSNSLSVTFITGWRLRNIRQEFHREMLHHSYVCPKAQAIAPSDNGKRIAFLQHRATSFLHTAPAGYSVVPATTIVSSTAHRDRASYDFKRTAPPDTVLPRVAFPRSAAIGVVPATATLTSRNERYWRPPKLHPSQTQERCCLVDT